MEIKQYPFAEPFSGTFYRILLSGILNETIDQIIQQKMMEMFTEQFESLKDKVVMVIANKISTLIEENNNLRSEIQQLRDTSETEKKELAVVHQLVTTFNSKLSDVQKEHEKAIQEMKNKVQSMEEMICKTKQSTQDELKSISDTVTVMLNEVPQSDAIINKFIELEESVKEVNSKCDNFEEFKERGSFIETYENSTQPAYSTQSLACPNNLIAELASELEERQKRTKSVVIHNVPESRTEEEDFDTVAEILNTVTGKELDSTKASITKFYRMGHKNQSKGRSIKVHFTTTEMSACTLENARRVSRTDKYKTVVVQKDLTPLERLNLKKLVTEKRKRNLNATKVGEEADWIIRGGILCRKQDFYFHN